MECTPGPQKGTFTGGPMPTPRLPQRFLQIIEGLSILSLPQGISGPPELVAEVSLGALWPCPVPSTPYPLLPNTVPPPTPPSLAWK